MTDPIPVRMVFGKGGARVEYEKEGVDHFEEWWDRQRVSKSDESSLLDASLKTVALLAWTAAHARLTDLEAVVKAAVTLCDRLDEMHLVENTFSKKEALKEALAKVGGGGAK